MLTIFTIEQIHQTDGEKLENQKKSSDSEMDNVTCAVDEIVRFEGSTTKSEPIHKIILKDRVLFCINPLSIL